MLNRRLWYWLLAIGLAAALGAVLYVGTAGEARAAAVAAPKLWVTPLVLDFGPVGVGMTSPSQVVTITNLGTATLGGFAGGGVSPPFYGVQNCAAGVPPGGSCRYTFTFRPTAVGLFTATSASGTNAGPITIELRGRGVGAGVAVGSLWLDFGSVWVDGGAETQVVEIHNTGMSTLTNFAGGGVSPPFYGTQTCAAGVPPGGSCRYTFSFDPSAAGTFSATSSTSTNAGPFSILLTGRGRSSLLLLGGQYASPLIIDFGPVGVGYESPTRMVTITNQGFGGPITDWVGGGVPAPFASTQDCAAGLAPGAMCRFYYRFRPTATGYFTEATSIINSAGTIRIEVRGQGVGAQVAVSPLVLDFGPVQIGATSPPQTVTIRNTGMSTLTNFAGGGVSPPFAATQNCASGVPPGGSCNYFFRFAPTAHGRFTALSSSSTNGGNISIHLFGGELGPLFLPLIVRGAQP